MVVLESALMETEAKLDKDFEKLKPKYFRDCYNFWFLFFVCLSFPPPDPVSTILRNAIETESDLAAFLLAFFLSVLFQFAHLVVGF